MGTDQRPLPEADVISAPFWSGVRDGRLLVQQCGGCGARQLPPVAICEGCGGISFTFEESNGRGIVYSYAILHRPRHIAFQDRVPLPVVVIELDSDPGAFLVGNLPGTPPDALRIGLEVEFVRMEVQGTALPEFRLRALDTVTS